MTTTSTAQPISPLLPSARLVLPQLPPRAKLLLVGEAPGEAEERKGVPFVGASGQLLDGLLEEVEIPRYSVGLTNVFNIRPHQNNLALWGAERSDCHPDPSLPWTFINAGKAPINGKNKQVYVKPSVTQPALARLRAEIEKLNPNLILALGATAFAALTGVPSIGKSRGTLYPCTLSPGRKVLGTYHPAAVLRQYDLRPICVVDLLKAKREACFPELRLRRRALYVQPTISDLVEWERILTAAPRLACDIETFRGQITCIGFSPSAEASYVVPFFYSSSSYWPTPDDEVIAYKIVRSILAGPSEKIFQNGMYDIQYCSKYGWRVNNFKHDTMILHHSLYPGMPKGLDFLGSIYCNERAWKQFRPRGGENFKRDE